MAEDMALQMFKINNSYPSVDKYQNKIFFSIYWQVALHAQYTTESKLYKVLANYVAILDMVQKLKTKQNYYQNQ